MADNVVVERDFFEVFVAQFAERFASPSEALPTVRCASKPALLSILKEVQEEVRKVASARRMTATYLLSRLEHSNLAHRISIYDPETGDEMDRLYAVGLAASEIEPDPMELMTAFQRKVVICYFTALHHHAFTTQVPSHHHFAVVSEEATPPKLVPPDQVTQTAAQSTQRTFDPMGTPQFIYQGLCYYRTNRDRRLVPGIQTRHLNDKSLVRITTREQTLIDTLHKPMSCGGPPVVFEAWGNGLRDLHENRVAKLLDQIADAKVLRRVGYMLKHFEYVPTGKLATLLKAIKPVGTHTPENTPIIPLLPGTSYSCVDPEWRVGVP